MNSASSHVFSALCVVFLAGRATLALEPIERLIPPRGMEIPAEVREQTRDRLRDLRIQLGQLRGHRQAADVDVLLKAADLALGNGEIYKVEDLTLLDKTLSLADERLALLKSGALNWTRERLTVRGFYSRIEGSPQPYGLVIPDNLANQPVPLYVWLHGRGDRTTDLHFISQRLTQTGPISPPAAIVLHPFGRQCIGFKWAGETDVLEAIAHVKSEYNIDPARVVLLGFSMGGAGTWHLAAHHTDQFAAASPGAGFVETARYNRLTDAQLAMVPTYERTLWSLYDVPDYTENLLQLPVVAYSGELDKQIQAAQVMEAAFLAHGRQLNHIVGPGMGHKYDPDSLAEIMRQMETAVAAGRNPCPRVVRLQTRTLRYSKMHWLRIDRLKQQWVNTQVVAELMDGWIRISTQSPVESKTPPVVGRRRRSRGLLRSAEYTSNVAQLTIDPLPEGIQSIVIDGQPVAISQPSPAVTLSCSGADHAWAVGPLPREGWGKKPGLQGPIDDAFLDRFLVVTPTKKASDGDLEQWIQFELDHLRGRWSALFRGTLPEKPDQQVTAADIQDSHLIVFGDPTSNSVLAKIMKHLPMQWSQDEVRVADSRHAGKSFVPLLIYPNPLNREKYVVVNSGPTFREDHDRTNSLQNPKLPDWAVLDIRTPPNGSSAGRVVQAGFFDEDWRLR